MKSISPYAVALTVTLASMMELLDATIVNVAVPTLMGRFGASVDEIAWISTGYVVANVVVLPISGWLSAYYGRRRYYSASIVVFVIASLGCAASSTLWELVACRVLQGLAGGGLLGISQAMIYDVFPRAKVSNGLAIYGVGVMMGPTLGPLVGGYLIENWSWHWIFLINLPLGAIASAAAWLTIRNSPHEERPARIDYAGFCLLAIGVGSLQVLLERGERWDWFESDRTLLFATASVLGLAAFIWWERRVAAPMVNLKLFFQREFVLGSICAFCVGFGLYGTLFMVPLYLQTMIGHNAFQAGLVIFPGALASAVSTLILGKLSQEGKIDERYPVVIGLMIYCYAMYLHSQFTLQSSDDSLFWPLLIRGFGLGMIFVPLTNLSMRQLPPHLISGASGVLNLMRQLGGSVGVATAAALFVRWGWIRYVGLSEHVSEQAIQRSAWAFDDPLLMTTLSTGSRVLDLALLPLLETQRQAQMLAFGMLFFVFGMVMAVGIPMAILIRRKPP